VPDLHQLKRCPLCGEVKKESSFRYIKYFDKGRTICKRCEARERQKKRRLVEQHVKEHGVTPRIRARLETEAAQKARRQATEAILSSLSPEQTKMYRWAKRAGRICVIVLYLSFCLGLFSFGMGAYGWLALCLLSGGIAVGGWRYFDRRHAKPVDSEIATHRRSIYPVLLEELKLERMEYERFYASPEWRITREKFLRTRRKSNGYYVCDICQGTIWQDRDVTVDHFKPRSKFPDLALDITNLRVAHRRCNSSKGDIIVGEE